MFLMVAVLLLMAVFVASAGRPAVAHSGAAYGVYGMATAIFAAFLFIGIARFVAAFTAVAMPVYYVVIVVAAVLGAWRARRLRRLGIRSRRGYEELLVVVFALAALVAVFTTAGIVMSVLFESVRFFSEIPLLDFLFGLQWSPQIAIREDQVGATGAFGFLPLLVGTLLISTIAMAVALPMGLLSAIYLSEFAARKTRNRIKPVLEILAGIPTIVYGFFAVTVLSPLLVGLGNSLGVGVAGENALAVGLVMGMLLIPFIASLSEDAFHAVPDSLRQGALGMGSTRYESTIHVIFPAALPGVVAGVLLAFSRAIGETMIVVMAAGISANLSINPLEAVTTITVQIVTLLTGDQEFDDAKTLAAFALGIVLFFITLIFNLVALRTVRKYQERYD